MRNLLLFKSVRRKRERKGYDDAMAERLLFTGYGRGSFYISCRFRMDMGRYVQSSGR